MASADAQWQDDIDVLCGAKNEIFEFRICDGLAFCVVQLIAVAADSTNGSRPFSLISDALLWVSRTRLRWTLAVTAVPAKSLALGH